MTTKRALSHLDALVNLTERADRQITSLATALTSVIEQIDAITGDADLQVTETIVEETTGKETEFCLTRTPVKSGSLTFYLDTAVVATENYEIDLATGVITSLATVPAGKEAHARYTVLGLASQTVQILDAIPELDTTFFTARKTRYQTAITWIENNFG